MYDFDLKHPQQERPLGYAERIYEQVKRLPEPVAKEVLDFAEFVAARRSSDADAAMQVDRHHRRAAIEQTFAKYQVDLSDFRFNRDDANARD